MPDGLGGPLTRTVCSTGGADGPSSALLLEPLGAEGPPVSGPLSPVGPSCPEGPPLPVGLPSWVGPPSRVGPPVVGALPPMGPPRFGVGAPLPFARPFPDVPGVRSGPAAPLSLLLPDGLFGAASLPAVSRRAGHSPGGGVAARRWRSRPSCPMSHPWTGPARNWPRAGGPTGRRRVCRGADGAPAAPPVVGRSGRPGAPAAEEPALPVVRPLGPAPESGALLVELPPGEPPLAVVRSGRAAAGTPGGRSSSRRPGPPGLLPGALLRAGSPVCAGCGATRWCPGRQTGRADGAGVRGAAVDGSPPGPPAGAASGGRGVEGEVNRGFAGASSRGAPDGPKPCAAGVRGPVAGADGCGPRGGRSCGCESCRRPTRRLGVVGLRVVRLRVAPRRTGVRLCAGRAGPAGRPGVDRRLGGAGGWWTGRLSGVGHRPGSGRGPRAVRGLCAGRSGADRRARVRRSAVRLRGGRLRTARRLLAVRLRAGRLRSRRARAVLLRSGSGRPGLRCRAARPADKVWLDCGGPDCGGPDCGGPDCGGPDCGGPDCGGPDCGGPDCGGPDCGGPDCGGPDCGGPDCGGPDCGGPDGPDCGRPDCGGPDGPGPERGGPEFGGPEFGGPDRGGPACR